MPEGTVNPENNRLLLTLDAKTAKIIQPHLEHVDLALRHSVYEPNKPIEYAYFPINGVISMLADMVDASPVEVATVGNEGMAGLPLSWVRT